MGGRRTSERKKESYNCKKKGRTGITFIVLEDSINSGLHEQGEKRSRIRNLVIRSF